MLSAKALPRMAESTGSAWTLHAPTPLGGGSTDQVLRWSTPRGAVVSKSGRGGPASRFQAEARQLARLAESEGLVIPEVLAVQSPSPESALGFIVMRYLEPAPRSPAFDEALGRGLATLHRSSAPRFGFDVTTFCGRTEQPNPWGDDWVAFYREHRLGVQRRLLTDRGQLGGRDARAFDRLLDGLEAWLSPGAPSLIHGDLWSGNALSTAEGPALIDPAAYFAHREAELGMTSLMGGFSPRMVAAYDEAWPLEPGWQERLPLYQLWHLANHATLFGGGYLRQSMEIVDRFV
ncbi:MAG: fructosamine kinase family protein [Myxococcota bacterium]